MKQILLCDDEPLIRQGVRKILESNFSGLSIVECANGLEGFKQISVSAPDLIIADVRMPALSGLEMLERAAAQGCTAPVVLISAYSDFDYARTAIRFGVKDYILKPINRFELLGCLRRILGPEDAAQPDVGYSAPGTDDKGGMERAMEYLRSNFFRNITLEDVSRCACMNPNYFSAVFKKHTGMKYIDYLTRLRLEKADNLLRRTTLQVSEIAQMVGYSSTKHFTHLYREKYGILPSETRKSI